MTTTTEMTPHVPPDQVFPTHHFHALTFSQRCIGLFWAEENLSDISTHERYDVNTFPKILLEFSKTFNLNHTIDFAEYFPSSTCNSVNPSLEGMTECGYQVCSSPLSSDDELTLGRSRSLKKIKISSCKSSFGSGTVPVMAKLEPLVLLLFLTPKQTFLSSKS
jgi:hypothetical protein